MQKDLPRWRKTLKIGTGEGSEAQTAAISAKSRFARRNIIKGIFLGTGAVAISAGVIEHEKIGQLVHFVEGLFLKTSFANSQLVQGFLHPQVLDCPAENTTIQLPADSLSHEVDEAGDSVGKGFFWQKNGQEGSAPASLFYGGAINVFLHQDYYRQQGYDGCAVQNVAVKSTVLSDLPRQFQQLGFTRPTTLIISDGGNLLLQWCIQNEPFLRGLMDQFREIATASDTQVQQLQRDLQKLQDSVEGVCLQLQGHYEIALGNLMGLKLDNAQLNTVVVLSIPPVWKAPTIPLSGGFHPKNTFPMRGNQAAEIFGRYLVISGNNAIKSALNNAYQFLKDYGIALRYQDITDIVDVMDGIHPVPSEQRKIALELLKHTYFGQTSLKQTDVPLFQES